MRLTETVKGKLLKKPQDPNRTERCVICMRKTAYSFSTPIQERTGYVEGCGQLCEECYREITGEARLLIHDVMKGEQTAPWIWNMQKEQTNRHKY